jgi:hypothetical protein
MIRDAGASVVARGRPHTLSEQRAAAQGACSRLVALAQRVHRRPGDRSPRSGLRVGLAAGLAVESSLPGVSSEVGGCSCNSIQGRLTIWQDQVVPPDLDARIADGGKEHA